MQKPAQTETEKKSEPNLVTLLPSLFEMALSDWRVGEGDTIDLPEAFQEEGAIRIVKGSYGPEMHIRRPGSPDGTVDVVAIEFDQGSIAFRTYTAGQDEQGVTLRIDNSGVIVSADRQGETFRLNEEENKLVRSPDWVPTLIDTPVAELTEDPPEVPTP